MWRGFFLFKCQNISLMAWYFFYAHKYNLCVLELKLLGDKGYLEYLWNNVIYKMHRMGFNESKLVFKKVLSFKLMFFTGGILCSFVTSAETYTNILTYTCISLDRCYLLDAMKQILSSEKFYLSNA